MLGQPLIETLHVEINDIVTYLKLQSEFMVFFYYTLKYAIV